MKLPKLKFKNEKLNAFYLEYGYLGKCFFIPAIIMLCIYFAIGHKPFGDYSVLTLDLNAQYVYFYEALRDAVWGDTSLLYSFSRSMGGEFMGIYAYYIASPLSYIVCLFPKELMLEALLTIICIKIGLCGLAFGFYLHKHTKNINRTNILLFSIMYSLSAYAITYQNNIMWLDSVILLPILAYAIERLVKEKRCKLFVATLALVMITHYYIGYMLCWFTIFYFFFVYFKDSDRTLVNPEGKKNNFIKSLTRIGLSSLLGVGIAAFMIAVAYYSLQFGKNEFSEPNWDFIPPRFDLFDLFPKMLPGAYDTVMHEGLPLLYCGVLSLFMLPIYFMAKKVDNKEKVFYGGLCLIYVFIMVINPFDLVMHGFQMPNCLNYRYSFILVFLMLIMSYKGFCELREHSAQKIFAIGAAILGLLVIAQKMEFPNFVLQDTEGYKFGFTAKEMPFFYVVVFTIIAVFTIGAILCYFIKSENQKKMSTVLLCAVCFELFANGIILTASLGYDVGIATYSSYVDYFKDLRPIVETIQEKDKTFYRMEKTTHRCPNDNMTLDMNGMSNSTSTLNASVIGLLDSIGIQADAHWSKYLGSTLVTESLLGVKYVVSNTENFWNQESIAQNELMDKYYELVEEDENYYGYKNPYSLSIGFAADSSINEFVMQMYYKLNDDLKEENEGVAYLNPFEIQNNLLNTLLGNEENEFVEYFTPIKLKNNSNIYPGFSSLAGYSDHYYKAFNDPEDKINFSFVVEKDGPLYMYLPSAWEKTITVYIDEEHYVTNYDSSRIIYLGERVEGEEMKVSLRLDEGKFYLYKNTDYIYTLNVNAFEEASKELSKSTIVTDERSNDDHIYGSIKTFNDNQTILLSIPYDEGWKITVDGKEIEAHPVLEGSMTAFEIDDSGEHSIELRYMPDIYVVSMIISGVSILIFIVWIVIDTIKKKKNPHAIIESESAEEVSKNAEGKEESKEEKEENSQKAEENEESTTDEDTATEMNAEGEN